MGEYQHLLQPITIGKKEVDNRFAINAMEGNDADPDGEAITVTEENVSRKMQLSIMPKNEKALTEFTKEMRKINPKPVFVWQLTHSGELSNPEFSKRVCVKPLPGFGGAAYFGTLRQGHRRDLSRHERGEIQIRHGADDEVRRSGKRPGGPRGLRVYRLRKLRQVLPLALFEGLVRHGGGICRQVGKGAGQVRRVRRQVRPRAPSQ